MPQNCFRPNAFLLSKLRENDRKNSAYRSSCYILLRFESNPFAQAFTNHENSVLHLLFDQLDAPAALRGYRRAVLAVAVNNGPQQKITRAFGTFHPELGLDKTACNGQTHNVSSICTSLFLKVLPTPKELLRDGRRREAGPTCEFDLSSRAPHINIKIPRCHSPLVVGNIVIRKCPPVERHSHALRLPRIEK